MTRMLAGNVISHWYKYVDGFNTSSKDFYAAVEQAIRQREVPGFSTCRVHWQEGGIVAARREYLRVSRDILGARIAYSPGKLS